MKSFFNNLSSRFPFFANRPSALERAVRQSPKSRRLRMEPLENRALLAVDAFGGAALADVGESWGPDPAPAFSASELSTDAAETTISLAALNDVPYGPYVTSEQAALIALRSNATLADETLADFNALWDDGDVATLETETDAETLSDVAESLTLESFDLGVIEQEPLSGVAATRSGGNGNSGAEGYSGDVAVISFGVSGGIDGSYVMPGTNVGTDAAILEGQAIIFTLSPKLGNIDDVVVRAELSGMDAGVDYTGNATRDITLSSYGGSFSVETLADYTTSNAWDDGDETLTITLSVISGTATLETTSFTVLVVEKPEFVSDVDIGKTERRANTDVYRSYIKRDAEAETSITARTPITAVGQSLRYTLSGTSDLFQINETTGAITLKSTAPALLAAHTATVNAHDWELQIKTQDTRFENYSGGDAYSDVATIRIDLSEWTVNRDKANATASATPADGCTIAELADYVGLDSDEFQEWLTKNDNASYALFNAPSVPGNELEVNSILAASASTSVANFAVPNTIYAAWSWNPGQQGIMNWSGNQGQLEELGFKVETFINYVGHTSGLEAKTEFANTIINLSQNKQLHGLFLVGHGSGNKFNYSSDDQSWGDNWGYKWYTTYCSWDLNATVADDSWGIATLDLNANFVTSVSALKYHLGALILQSCESDNLYTRNLVSQQGIFKGFTGGCHAINDAILQIAKYWGEEFNGNICTHGGAQATKTYSFLYA